MEKEAAEHKEEGCERLSHDTPMTEEFLHHIWKVRNFEHQHLLTTAGETIEVMRPGEHNTDAGPDFSNARIRIGNLLWAGNVEIHLRASDWNRHRHYLNRAYDNVVLHVVYEADEHLEDERGKYIPTLELKGRIHPAVFQKYTDLQCSTTWVPCGKQLASVPRIVVSSWLERLLVERLESKSNRILETLAATHNDWEESFYQHLARNFGFRVNALPFEWLAKICPLNLIAHYRDNLMQIEALLFGQAGLLNDHLEDTYAQRLQAEYQFLARKHRLEGNPPHLWKFLRLRPMNFPSLRIAQFAKLLHRSDGLFSKILDVQDASGLKKLFATGVSPYWETHYQFGKSSVRGKKWMGEAMVENIAINTIAPFLFVYGRQQGNEELTERVLKLLDGTKPENNTIIRQWAALGLKAQNGSRSQALLQLKTGYCNSRRCLACGIGSYLLKK